MLKLKFQYFCCLMWRTDSLEKTLMLEKLKVGGEGDNRGWDSWMASLTWYTWVWASSWSRWWTGKPGVLQSMGSQSRTWLSKKTELSRLCPWDFPSKNTGEGCHFLLQEVYLTQESNPGLLHLLPWQVFSLPLHHFGSPKEEKHKTERIGLVTS